MAAVIKVNSRGTREGKRWETTVTSQVRENGGFEQWSPGGDSRFGVNFEVSQPFPAGLNVRYDKGIKEGLEVLALEALGRIELPPSETGGTWRGTGWAGEG